MGSRSPSGWDMKGLRVAWTRKGPSKYVTIMGVATQQTTTCCHVKNEDHAPSEDHESFPDHRRRLVTVRTQPKAQSSLPLSVVDKCVCQSGVQAPFREAVSHVKLRGFTHGTMIMDGEGALRPNERHMGLRKRMNRECDFHNGRGAFTDVVLAQMTFDVHITHALVREIMQT